MLKIIVWRLIQISLHKSWIVNSHAIIVLLTCVTVEKCQYFVGTNDTYRCLLVFLPRNFSQKLLHHSIPCNLFFHCLLHQAVDKWLSNWGKRSILLLLFGIKMEMSLCRSLSHTCTRLCWLSESNHEGPSTMFLCNDTGD